MDKSTAKTFRRDRRKKGMRKTMSGTPSRPRLSVYRSLQHIYAQLIDDLAGRTVAAASSLDVDGVARKGGNVDAAKQIGMALAERAKKAGVPLPASISSSKNRVLGAAKEELRIIEPPMRG